MGIRVIQGPATIGNLFGYYGHHVPVDRFAVVEDDEYANGGRGPCAAIADCLFRSREAAEKEATRLNRSALRAELENNGENYLAVWL